MRVASSSCLHVSTSRDYICLNLITEHELWWSKMWTFSRFISFFIWLSFAYAMYANNALMFPQGDHKSDPSSMLEGSIEQTNLFAESPALCDERECVKVLDPWSNQLGPVNYLHRRVGPITSHKNHSVPPHLLARQDKPHFPLRDLVSSLFLLLSLVTMASLLQII